LYISINSLTVSTGKGGKRRPAYHCGRGHKRFGIKKATFDETIQSFITLIELSNDFKEKLVEEEIRTQWFERKKEFNFKAININTKIIEIDRQIEKS
jgi:hypothetical protein